MNCLAYALRFWDTYRDYPIWYNSDHCINLPKETKADFRGGRIFLPAKSFGYNYFYASFGDFLSEEEHLLLKEYFK